MIIKKIKLNNIRSYEEEELHFNKGSTLLSGDIGSGKTSILLAIEFALFGLQPGQRGSSILRNGKETGGVVIELEIDEDEITIERTLKRGKTINQDYCSIKVNGEKKELSVMELKSSVLTLLNYPSEFSKKQNLLYKFTVYTPQEEMKQIILEDPKTRLNILRHVFGVDKYKKILENVSIVIQKIREEKRIKIGQTMNLESEKENLNLKKENLQEKKFELKVAEIELLEKTSKKEKIEIELKELSEKIEEKKRLKQEIEKTKIMISTKNDSILQNVKTIKKLKEEIDGFDKKEFNPNLASKIEEEIKNLKNLKDELSEKNIEITSKINSLSLQNQESDTLKKKIGSLEICPTCLQDVKPVYKSNVVNKMESTISKNIKEIENLVLEKRDVTSKFQKIEFEISLKQKELQEIKLEKIKLEGIIEKEQRLEELEKSNIFLEKDINLLKSHNDSLTNSSFELGKFVGLFDEKQIELETQRKKERASEILVAELKKEIMVFSSQIDELKEKIKKTEEIKNELNKISSLENWLSTKFIPIISHVEQNVMIKLKSRFSKVFSEWFSMLVPDSFEVRLSDDFTPIVEQHDYELDYEYLSGGERTAIALAYRLALNQVINSLMSKIKTRDLVILDEPTDGFSSSQLDKMREVLEELDVAQLIIVSHEQKIEGFVENVIRLKKDSEISIQS